MIFLSDGGNQPVVQNGCPKMSYSGHGKKRNTDTLHCVQSGETSDVAERRGTFALARFSKFQILIDSNRAMDAGNQFQQFKKTRGNSGEIHPFPDCECHFAA
jgi:hypothetical protein